MKKERVKVLIFIASLVLMESISYFLAKLSPLEPTLLTSKLDSSLPLIPFFIYFYSLWYLLLFAVPYIFYLKDKNKLFKYAGATLISVFISFFIFFFFPTTIIRPEIEVTNITTFILNFIYLADTPALNCLPSMHCVLCFLFVILAFKTVDLKRKYKFLIITLSMAVVVSTMFIKQHVIWDVMTGLLLAIISLLIVKFTKFDKFIEKKVSGWIAK